MVVVVKAVAVTVPAVTMTVVVLEGTTLVDVETLLKVVVDVAVAVAVEVGGCWAVTKQLHAELARPKAKGASLGGQLGYFLPTVST